MDVSQYKPRKKWPLLVGGMLVLLLAVYFIGTSGWFIRSVVLPQVAAKLGSDLSAEEVSLSPFSQLELRKVKLTPRGSEPLLAVDLVRVRYGLMAILGGDILVDEVAVETPTITVIEKLAGDGNLAKLLAALQTGPTAAKPESTTTPKFNLHNVALKNATLRYSLETAPGVFDVSEVTGLNLTLDQLGNGQTGKLGLSLAGATAQSTNRIAFKGQGAFNVGLDAKLMPSVINGQLTLELGAATGAFKELANGGATLAVDLATTELKQLQLAFTRGTETLGTVSLSGPYDFAKREARITYAIAGIDQRVLSLVGGPLGIGFGQTAVSANGRVDLAQFGQLVASFGKVSASQFGLVLTNGTTPVLDLALDYKFSVNLSDKTALAEKVDVQVDQAGRALVRGSLDRPMNLAWDRTAPGFREATFTLNLTGLELADWRPLGGPLVPAGKLSVSSKVTADRDGRLLKLDLAGGIDRLTGAVAGATLNQLQVTFSAAGSLEDFVASTLEKSELVVRDQADQVAKVTLFANHHQQQKVLGLQGGLEVDLPRVLKIHPVEGLAFSHGVLQSSFQTTLREGATNIAADISVAGLTGRLQGAELSDYHARVQAGVDLRLNTITLPRLTLTAQTGTKGGGSIDLAGKFDPQSGTGDFNFKSVGFNENALGPFVAAAIAPNRLLSISLDGDGTGTLALAGESTFKGQLKVQNFVAEDPEGKLPKTPLGLGFTLDASQRAQAVDLRQFKLDLGATARAENTLSMSGKVDLATSNAAPSSLSVRSSGLDLTPLFNLFAAPGTNAAPAKPAPAATPATEQEPPALALPWQRFDLDLDIARLFLREVAVSNWVAKLKLTTNSVALESFSLSLNGAPVQASALANVGVPGYTYDVNVSATNVPVPPLARSFMTGPQVDLHGQVALAVALKGAGVTGASLRKHLAGTAQFAATGLDYQVEAVKSPLLKTLVTVLTTVLRLPNVTQSPIDAIVANVVAGQGILRLGETKVVSPAFAAVAGGQIELADILTNSVLNLPVSISIPKDGKLEKLPDFLTMRGTLGKPETKIDPVALAQVALRLPGGIGDAATKGLNRLGGAVEKATGGILPNVGGLLTGQKSTNEPAKGGGLGGVIGGIFGGNKGTNSPAGTNQPASLNPFNLLKPKKQP